LRATLPQKQLRKLLGGPFGNSDQFFVADFVAQLAYGAHAEIWLVAAEKQFGSGPLAPALGI
jgi:hypothetical protein